MNELEDLPEFNPPDSFCIESELESPIPRPIPEIVKSGKYYQSQKKMFIWIFSIGIVIICSAYFPSMSGWGNTIQVSSLLAWIGSVFCLISLLPLTNIVFFLGPFRYIKEGVPIAVRVFSVVKAPSSTVNGETSHYVYHVEIEFINPQNEKVNYMTVRSDEFSAAVKDNYSTSLLRGQYLTGIYLPGKLQATLTLYGFLGLNPEASVIQRKKIFDKKTLFAIILGITAIVMFMGALVGCLISLEYCRPLEYNLKDTIWPMIIGGVLFGALFNGYFYWNYRKTKKVIQEKNKKALQDGGEIELLPNSFVNPKSGSDWLIKMLMLIGMPLLGSYIGLCSCFYLNTLADRSESKYKNGEITSVKRIDHRLAIHDYLIEYVIAGSDETYKIRTNDKFVETIMTNLCIVEIKKGNLGWPWVKQLHPIMEPSDIN